MYNYQHDDKQIPWSSIKDKITTVEIEEKVTSIGNNIFVNCTAIKSFDLPQSLTSIGDCSFESCISLQSISFSENINSIGYNPFVNCTALESIEIHENNNYFIFDDKCLFDEDTTRLRYDFKLKN